jgi:hypothetical protein
MFLVLDCCTDVLYYETRLVVRASVKVARTCYQLLRTACRDYILVNVCLSYLLRFIIYRNTCS